MDPYTHEDLANWFFRLNGCLTIPNFVVHPEVGANQRTDADILAVRFPHRREMLSKPLQDHGLFTLEKNRLQVFLVEVKAGRCSINIPWKEAARKNVNTVISALGFAPLSEVDKIAQSIYTTGQYSDKTMLVRFVCVGNQGGNLGSAFKHVPQIVYSDILHFIHGRFRGHDKAKRSHPQWDKCGQDLYSLAQKNLQPAVFCKEFLKGL